VANRTIRGSGCPFCAGRRASGAYCLAVAHPEIAREWHPTRKILLTPASSARSHSATSQRGRAPRDIRIEHRRIEQILLLLLADAGVEDGVVSRFVDDMAAHLDLDTRILYPALERALGPIVELRKVQVRLQRALSRLSLRGKGAIRIYRLRRLHAVFQEHCRLEERAALPFIQSLKYL
jgi:hypothetical protein